jgi:hypothetical protein
MRAPALALAAAALPLALAFDCAAVSAGHDQFDLHALGGPRTVVTSRFVGASYLNTSYTVDICGALEREGGEGVGGDECPSGTRGESG